MEKIMTYEKIKDYYDRNLWQEFQVAKMVEIGTIAADEYKEITGNDYQGEVLVITDEEKTTAIAEGVASV